MNEVWVTGRVTACTDQGQVWEVQGIFPDEAGAVGACRDWTYFVMPLPFGVSFPHETMEHDARAHYPMSQPEGAELP